MLFTLRRRLGTTNKWLVFIMVLQCMAEKGIIGGAKTNRLPQFSQEKRAKSINEEQPVGTFILRSTATDYEGDEIVYSIEGDTNGYFQIDPKNGDLKTARIIDKESLDNNVISFKIVAAEGRNPSQKSYQKVDIIINDINDNPPVFTPESTDKVVNLTENLSGSTFVTQIRAVDKDKSTSGILFYTIAKGNEAKYFKMNLYNGKITTTKELDYEAVKSFKLEVIAMDGRPKSKGVHKVRTNVYINVLDEDDNGAKFDSNYSKPIIEGEYTGQKLLRVHAEDQDKGINSPIIYRIEPASNPDNIFSINKDGYIFVNGIIDRERTPVYNLELRAEEEEDSHFNPLHRPAKATLTVTVEDTNDNPPIFTQHNFLGHVTEHESPGTRVATVKAVDRDEGEHAKFTYRLEGKDSEMFRINEEGDIFVNGDTDREKKYLYRFYAIATQAGQPEAKTQVDIIVHDKNDHKPVFKKKIYLSSVPENSPLNTTIVKVEAEDRDENLNGKIRYSIEPHADDLCFHIDPKKGVISLRCQVDREYKNRYDFLVTAADQAENLPRSSQVRVQVDIEDVNDNFPVFTKTEYFKSINYDESIGSTILHVKATDKDDSDGNNFGKVQYRIVNSDSMSREKFAIKRDTGAVIVGSHLTDTSGTFKLEIEAFDNMGNYPSRKSIKNAQVTITIEKKGDGSVVLFMKAKTAIVVANEDGIARQLRQLLEYNVHVDDIEGGGDQMTRYIFHAYRFDNYKVVPANEIITRFSSYQGVRMEDFMRNWNITRWEGYGQNPDATKIPLTAENSEEDDKKNQTWTPIIYAVLGFSALIVIFGIIGILYLIRSRRRYIDGGASQTSSRVPINPSSRPRARSYWNDPGFESVSQINTESYVHSSGFLSRSVDKYELDPSNMYNGQEIYNDDPFSVIIERPPSRSSNSSHASSGFAASSVMTVYRAPNMVNNPTHQKTGGDSQPLLRENHRSRAGSHGPSPRDRKLSVIVDEDGNSLGLVDPMDNNHHRPPSYEYDFDTKPEGSFA
ncbi:cadherin-related family member 1-like [Clytia hemisphaerica]|uniref:Cadherin domain-containing protein n=1 Tax=Clytia hemisphaerica TaxID=252671 RepID=A0A7M5X348_9CNID|eukprot:TCONS_00005947-protein